MAVSPLHLDLGVTGPLIVGLPPISVGWWCKRNLIVVQGLSVDGGFEPLCCVSAKVKSQGPSGEDVVTLQGLQDDISWKLVFSDPTEWWDYRRGKNTPRHPDFRHKKSREALWLSSLYKPAWVERQLAMWDAQLDAGVKGRPRSVSTSVPRASLALGPQKSDLGIGTCRKLCEDGQVGEAIDALNLLVHQGYHIPSDLFYHLLKRCTLQKDLSLGRRIHALTLESGYEGNAFLANHLIGLYSSCGRLEEAMRAFSSVSTPDVYMWASIIGTYARHGNPTEAVTLYRQMRESTVKPDNRIFIAVLKACATAGDLDAGKDIHSHLLASAGKLDMYVQNSLVHMYAKCGSLEDAQTVFYCLSHKTVVTWNAMISGCAQQGMGQEALSLYESMQQEGLINPNSVTFTCLLQACAGLGAGALQQGKKLHAQIEQLGLQADVVVGGSLVNMYAKCRSLEDAQRVFDRLSQKNVVTWNAMIAGYAQQGMGEEALSLYRGMERGGVAAPDSFTFVSLLQACGIVGVAALHQGRQLHVKIEKRGLVSHEVVGTSLVNMYAKCGSIEDAQTVFDALPQKNVVSWNAMIAGYAHQGMGQKAFNLYHCMQHEAITPPDSFTFSCLLQACATEGVAGLHQGTLLHAQIDEQGLQYNLVVGNSLINMYTKCGSLENAQWVFDRLPQRNVVTWTSMIAGYVQQGGGQHALMLYSCMQQEGLSHPNSVTFVCLLQACAYVAALDLGKQIHADIEEQDLGYDLVIGNSLIDMYCKCDSLEDARRVFDRLPHRDVITWNTMFAGYARQGRGEEALSLYGGMQQDFVASFNSMTYICLLQACSSLGVSGAHWGKKLHVQIEEQGVQFDVVVVNSLITMYAKCGSIEDARSIFDSCSTKDVVTWNAMISGYAQQGMGHKALSLYSSMQEDGIIDPSSVTFICLLQACAGIGVGALYQGRQLHAQIELLGMQADVVVGASLVSMYAKCGSLEYARRVFDRLSPKNVVTWNAMITGYGQQGMVQEALGLYSSMEQEGITKPDSVTFVCLLQACAAMGALPLAKQLHGQIQGRGLQTDMAVGPSLINMYAKCGSLEDAQEVFDSLPKRQIEAWGALIGGYAQRGNSEIVFDLFDRMRLEGMQPDSITFLSLLTACNHVGLVEKGQKYFEAMSTDYGISPNFEHYTRMIDLQGRAGYLDKGLQMVKTMPFQPNAALWLTLLGACRKWSNVEVGRQAFEFAVRLDENHPASYILMSNIYAGAGMWEEAKEMQLRRKQSRAWKEPGQCWWTDMDGVVHSFVVGDKMHPRVEASQTSFTSGLPV